MAKEQKNAGLLDLALEATVKNTTKPRGGSGRKTYLDRFVDVLTDENGQPTEPKTRNRVIAEMSLGICIEKVQDRIDDGEDVAPFALAGPDEEKTEHDELFAEVNGKVKAQVANAVANNNNGTSLSYNPAYKDVWTAVVGDDKKISLEKVEA